MKCLTTAQPKRLTAIHGLSGTISGLLLHPAVMTGTMVVFVQEIGRWSAAPRPVRGAQPTAVTSPDAKKRPIF